MAIRVDSLYHDYTIVLSQLNEVGLGELVGIKNFNYSPALVEMGELTFNLPKHQTMEDGRQEETPLYNRLEADMLLEVKDGEIFYIDKCAEVESSEGVEKQIHAYQREYELSMKSFNNYDPETERFLYFIHPKDGVGFPWATALPTENGLDKYTTDTKDESGEYFGVFNKVEELTGWKLKRGSNGFPLLPDDVAKSTRLITTAETNLLELMDTIQEAWNCVFKYDTRKREIEIIPIDLFTQAPRGLLSDENFITGLTKEMKSDEVKTRLYMYNYDGVGVLAEKMAHGGSYIENYDYFKNDNYMTRDLQNAIDVYMSNLEQLQGQTEALWADLKKLYNEKDEVIRMIDDWEKDLIDPLTTYEHYVSVRDGVVINEGTEGEKQILEPTPLTERQQIQLDDAARQMAMLNANISTYTTGTLIDPPRSLVQLEKLIEAQMEQLKAVQKEGVMSSVFARFEAENNLERGSLMREMEPFIRDTTHQSENIKDADDLHELAKSLVLKIARPRVQFSIDVVDFLTRTNLNEFDYLVELGQIIQIKNKKMDFSDSVILLKYNHSPESGALTLDFSNELEMTDETTFLAEMIARSNAVSTKVSFQSAFWSGGGQVGAGGSGVNGVYTDLVANKIQTNRLVASEIEALRIETGELVATKASIEELEADSANIRELVSEKASIEALNAGVARIGTLEATSATISQLNAEKARIDTLDAKTIAVEELVAKKASIVELEAAVADITKLTADTAEIERVIAGHVETGTLTAEIGRIETLVSDSVDTLEANVGQLYATKATVGQLSADIATIEQLQTSFVKTTELEADYITAGTIAANYADIGLTTVAQGTFESMLANDLVATEGFIRNLKVGTANIAELDAAVITAGTIAADKIMVRNPSDPTKSVIFAINNISGNIEQTEGNVIDGKVMMEKSINADKIVAKSITASEIAGGAITGDEIKGNSIVAGHITTGAITAGKIATGAVEADKIKAGSITVDKLSGQSITADWIGTNAITAAKINAEAVTAEKIKTGAITTRTLDAEAITAAKIAANAITTDKIKAGAITATEIAGKIITAEHIFGGSITATEIAGKAITAEKIDANAILAGHIKAGEVVAGKLAANSVVAGNITTDAVTADKIKARAITAEKVALGQLTADHIKAGSLTADDIKAGTLVADRIKGGTLTLGGALNAEGVFKLVDQNNRNRITMTHEGMTVNDGSIVIKDANNRSVITSQGLKMQYIYTSQGTWQGWQIGGIVDAYDGVTKVLNALYVVTPEHLIIEKATLTLKSLPFWIYYTLDPPGGSGAPPAYYHAGKLQLFKLNDPGDIYYEEKGVHLSDQPAVGPKTAIGTPWTPPGGSGAGLPHPSGKGMQTRVMDITPHITENGRTTLVLESAHAATMPNTRYKSAVQLELEVTGYLKG